MKFFPFLTFPSSHQPCYPDGHGPSSFSFALACVKLFFHVNIDLGTLLVDDESFLVKFSLSGFEKFFRA